MQQDDLAEITRVLTTFYFALLGRGDLEEAARWATPDLRLLPNPIVGFNVNIDEPDPGEIAEGLVRVSGELAAPDPTGDPVELLEMVHERRGGANRRYPFEFWRIASIDLDGAHQAHAVTQDGSCGLRRVDGRWRVAWLLA